MDRSSSSRQLQRSERIANSPYKRPTQQAVQATPRSPIASFPSLRSIYSFVTAPFSRQPLLPQTNQDLQIEEDQKSQSGSEDGWNGSPPPGMEVEDVSSLAAAGRRIEYDVESQEEDPSSTHNSDTLAKSTSLVSRSVESQHSGPRPQSSSLAASTSRFTPATFTPGLYGTKRPIASSVTPTMSRRPLPSFLPQAATGQSAASIALTAFVEAKKGEAMTPQDMRVMRTLMEDIEAEQPGASASQNRWTAGIDSPRQVKSIRESQAPAGPSTPNRLVKSIRGSPGPMFSVGSPARSEAGPNGDSPASRRIRYLGPGMSPKRMLNKSRNSDKPLFTSDVAEESEPKRQKTETTPTTPEANFPSGEPSPSKPHVPSYTSRALDRTKNFSTPAKPSPLSRVNSPTPASPREQQSIESGKRRAADIVKELMEKEIGPIETLSKRDYMVINPYDLPTPTATSRSDLTSSLSNSVSRNATPKKSILRSSLKGSTSTPLSGAAAKLEAYKPGRKLTTLELLDGKRPWTDNVDQTMRSQSPTPKRDTEEVDELMDDSPAPSRQRSPSPDPVAEPAQINTSRPLPKMPAPFDAPAFKAPEVSSSARPIPTFAASPAKSRQPASSSMAPPPVPTPKFAPSAHVPTAPLAEIENSTLASISKTSTKGSKALSPAQKVVLNRPADSLPTYVFKVSMPKSAICAAARKEALEKPLEPFNFNLAAPSSSKKTPSFTMSQMPPSSSNSEAAWTCSLCFLQNSGSAKEKCTICEAPRPAPKPVSQPFTQPAGSASFGNQMFNSMKASASDAWTCDTCMLQNPGSAKEKCAICDAPRPAPNSSTKFAFGSSTSKASGVSSGSTGGPWTCGLCMLQNPDSAKEKCQICEAKRP